MNTSRNRSILTMLAGVAVTGVLALTAGAQETKPAVPSPADKKTESAGRPLLSTDTQRTGSSSTSSAAQAGDASSEANATPASDIPATKTKADSSTYVIGAQDVLNVSVWKEPELSGPVTVRPDGKITLPMVNDVYVVGMTTEELQQLLAEKLKPFVNVPQVTVSPREINSRKVYLIGQVAREGAVRINSSMTVLQVIAEAGGLRDFAKRKKIYVMRAENGKQVRYPFNYDEVIQGKNTKQNIELQPGDTIVVP